MQGCQQQGSNHVPIMMSKGQAINLIYNNTDIWHIVVFLSLKRIAEFCFVLSDIYKNTKECEHLINMLVTHIYIIRGRRDRMVVGFTKLHMQSVPITTKVVSSNTVHGEVYLIQHYMIKFVSDLGQVGGFLVVL